MWTFSILVTVLCHVVIADEFQMEKLKELEVVPDVIPAPPNEALTVIYPNGKAINFGNVLTPSEASKQPSVRFTGEDQKLYTLLMVDPDAPSRQAPKFREWRHWVVVNIPGGDVSKGQVLTPYKGPGPPKGTGLHRYVFLLYKQTSELVSKEEGDQDENRGKFSAIAFANKYKLGDPISANFFQSQNK